MKHIIKVEYYWSNCHIQWFIIHTINKGVILYLLWIMSVNSAKVLTTIAYFGDFNLYVRLSHCLKNGMLGFFLPRLALYLAMWFPLSCEILANLLEDLISHLPIKSLVSLENLWASHAEVDLASIKVRRE